MRITLAEQLEVCEEVGRGGFGVVYRGIVRASGLEVAIKQIDLENEQADLFDVHKEIQILSECNIPQITQYLGCFVKQFKLWVVMEYVSGGSLYEILRPGPIDDEVTIAVIGREILLALKYLHGSGKIHRDLKLQNILLHALGEVKLTDFGVSTQLYSNFSRRNTTVGTPYWMAPEVIVNNVGGHSYKADIWLLGCCMYELRSGKPPLQEDFPAMKALQKLSTCKSDEDFWKMAGLDDKPWSKNFKNFLKKCFTVDPVERPNAEKLLHHKLILLAAIAPEAKHKIIKRLITRKLLWDQENHVTRTQKYYAPTELVLNQEKWRNGGSVKEKVIQFDFSDDDMDAAPDAASEPPKREKSPPGAHSRSRSESALRKSLGAASVKNELNRVLNRAFSKLEHRAPLSTEQYDQLVKLNQILLGLCVDYLDASKSQAKIVVCQYLKYVIKEIQRTGERAPLSRLILPLNIHESQESPEPRRGEGPLDEIERSLLESWIRNSETRKVKA